MYFLCMYGVFSTRTTVARKSFPASKWNDMYQYSTDLANHWLSFPPFSSRLPLLPLGTFPDLFIFRLPPPLRLLWLLLFLPTRQELQMTGSFGQRALRLGDESGGKFLWRGRKRFNVAIHGLQPGSLCIIARRAYLCHLPLLYKRSLLGRDISGSLFGAEHGWSVWASHEWGVYIIIYMNSIYTLVSILRLYRYTDVDMYCTWYNVFIKFSSLHTV